MLSPFQVLPSLPAHLPSLRTYEEHPLIKQGRQLARCHCIVLQDPQHQFACKDYIVFLQGGGRRRRLSACACACACALQGGGQACLCVPGGASIHSPPTCSIVVGMTEELCPPGTAAVLLLLLVAKLEVPARLLPTLGSPATESTMVSMMPRTVSSHSWNVGLKDGRPDK